MEGFAIKVGRNVFWNGIGILFTSLFGLVTSIFVARLLGPYYMGIYGYLVWLVGAVSVLVSFGLPGAILKYVSEVLGRDDSETAYSIVSRFFVIELGLSLLGFLIISVGALVLASNDIKKYLILGAFTIVPSTIGTILCQSVNAAHEYRRTAPLRVASALAQAILFPIVLWLGFGLFGLLISWICVEILSLFLSYKIFKEVFNKGLKILANLNRDLMGRIWKFALAMAIMTFLDAVVWQRSETFFLKMFSTLEQISYYTIAYSLARLISFIPSLLSGVMMPVMSAKYGTKDIKGIGEIYYHTAKYLAILAFPVSLLGAAAAPAIINIMYGANYSASVPVFKVLIVFNVFGVISSISSLVTYSTENQMFNVKLGTLAAGINILFALLMIPKSGALGAAWANSLAQLMAVIVGNIYIVKKYNFRLPMVDFVKIFLSAAGAAFIAVTLSSEIDNIRWNFFSVIAVGFPVYLCGLWLLKIFDVKDADHLKRICEGFPLPVKMLYFRTVIAFVNKCQRSAL